jgi:hypothetical protein
LKREKIKKEAKEMGLEKIIKEQMKDPENQQMNKQYQYILDELYNTNVTVEETSDEDFEDDNYGDEEMEDEDYVFILIKY